MPRCGTATNWKKCLFAPCQIEGRSSKLRDCVESAGQLKEALVGGEKPGSLPEEFPEAPALMLRARQNRKLTYQGSPPETNTSQLIANACFMTRIFPTLASLSLGLYLASIVVGLSIGDLYDYPDQATLRWRGVHMLTGTSAALAVVFVLSIAVTYFVGTSRWCKEVTETYRLDVAPLCQSNLLKRRTFPLCVLGMLTVVTVGALGAASDPGTGRPNTADMADVHFIAALTGLAVLCWCYYRIWLNMAANQVVIQQIVAQVGRIRRERGLDAIEGSPGQDSPMQEEQTAPT